MDKKLNIGGLIISFNPSLKNTNKKQPIISGPKNMADFANTMYASITKLQGDKK